MFEVDVNGLTQQYRTKPTMNVDITGSSGSIPKPLTYDYMPEGYPSKGIEYVTLFGEHELPFYNIDGIMAIEAPIGGEIAEKDKLTVVWDGTSYDVVVKKIIDTSEEYLVFGNLGLLGDGETTDYPFYYDGEGCWYTADLAASHTIKVMRQQVTITPMSTDFIPKNLNVVFSGDSSTTIPNSCNVTYDELRGWIENGTPVFAIYINKDVDGSVVDVINITSFKINTNSLNVYYLSGSSQNYFEYKSDGTFSGGGPS